MEFECKRLQQRLDSLRSDDTKKIRSWTEHSTEFGNTIVIKFSNKSKPTRESCPPSSQYQESEKASDASHSPHSPAEKKSDTREETSSQSHKTVETTIFKPMSQYQMKRDRERKEAFKVRCATRSRSDLDSHDHTPSDSSKSPLSSVELKRGDNVVGSEQPVSDLCLSPDFPVESPYADDNPYSCLQMDSPAPSVDTEELYDDDSAVLRVDYPVNHESDNLNLPGAEACDKSVVSDVDIKSTEIYKNCILPLLRKFDNMDSQLKSITDYPEKPSPDPT